MILNIFSQIIDRKDDELKESKSEREEKKKEIDEHVRNLIMPKGIRNI